MIEKPDSTTSIDPHKSAPFAIGNGKRPLRLIVGITGATGSILGIRMLEALRALGVETYLVMSGWAEHTMKIETTYTIADVRSLASIYYREGNQAAAVSSGSFPVDGMVIIPCSMNTLAAIAHGLSDNLIVRAADVTLKERRPLVIVPRETPLNSIHLRNMLTLSEIGVSITPPMPAFYNRPQTVDDIVDHIVARALDQLGIDNDLTGRWGDARSPVNPARGAAFHAVFAQSDSPDKKGSNS
jgi:flavin prenyltransferase